jgi:hypothetical protein
MNSTDKLCVACGIERERKYFVGVQVICNECKLNPDLKYEIVCNTCEEKKGNDMFYKGRAKCKECVLKSGRVKPKTCIACNQEKESPLFRRSQPICIDCEANKDVEYKKTCEECNTIKSSKLFRTNRKKCMDCEKADGRNYRRVTDKAAIWAQNNPEKMSQLQHNSYEKNKTEIRAKQSQRYHEDAEYKAIKNYRISLCRLLSDDTAKRNMRMKINREQYIEWLNFRFEEDMNMENHVKLWQVDHVLPLNILSTKSIQNLSFEDEDLECVFIWYNTMPVYSEKNMKKNKYLDKEQLIKHIIAVKKFLKKNTKLGITTDDHFITYKRIVQQILDDK